MLQLDRIVLKETHFHVLFINFNCEWVSDILYCEVLSYTFELAYDYFVRYSSFILALEVLKSLTKNHLRADSIWIRTMSDTQIWFWYLCTSSYNFTILIKKDVLIFFFFHNWNIFHILVKLSEPLCNCF
jgi:hypothetical protein